jgi:hypothetical protein
VTQLLTKVKTRLYFPFGDICFDQGGPTEHRPKEVRAVAKKKGSKSGKKGSSRRTNKPAEPKK